MVWMPTDCSPNEFDASSVRKNALEASNFIFTNGGADLLSVWIKKGATVDVQLVRNPGSRSGRRKIAAACANAANPPFDRHTVSSSNHKC